MQTSQKTVPPDVILASQSARRKELLTAMGVKFKVLPSNFEEQLDHSRSPREVAIELALGKALSVARRHPEAIVIASDTIVTLEGMQYGKSVNADEQHAVLRILAGKEHLVTSSLVIVCLAQGLQYAEADETTVVCKPWDEAVANTYVASNDWRDKAAYSVQNGHMLVDHLKGRYDTVLGLPTHLLAPQLERLGIAAHAVNPPCPVPILQ